MIKLELDLPPGIVLSSITWLRTMNKWCVYVAMPGVRPGGSDPIGGGCHEDINESARLAIDQVRWRYEQWKNPPPPADDLLKELGL